MRIFDDEDILLSRNNDKNCTGFILEALDAENEGIRTHAIKFIEVLVLSQSLHPNPPEDGSEVQLK